MKKELRYNQKRKSRYELDNADSAIPNFVSLRKFVPDLQR